MVPRTSNSVHSLDGRQFLGTKMVSRQRRSTAALLVDTGAELSGGVATGIALDGRESLARETLASALRVVMIAHPDTPLTQKGVATVEVLMRPGAGDKSVVTAGGAVVEENGRTAGSSSGMNVPWLAQRRLGWHSNRVHKPERCLRVAGWESQLVDSANQMWYTGGGAAGTIEEVLYGDSTQSEP
jgi:hypothetical protein